MRHINIWISGRVQKVGFRFSAMQAAYRFGILGFVQNLKNGIVYIEAEGGDDDLNSFVKWCKRGPLGAKVEDVEIRDGETKDFQTFEIISSRPGTS
ncbi:MAG: acylphosphatase [Bacteroidetes bacterium]|nr:acylphosphatase [Bacteroidota bacterium]